MEVNELTGEIIDAAIKVHRELGPGLLESAYQGCLQFELSRRKIRALREVEMPVQYDGYRIDVGYRIDLLVEDLVIVECKCVDAIHPIHKAQVLSYLKMSNLKVGLLMNFHSYLLKDGIVRLANNT